jgi:hypothetical protein
MLSFDASLFLRGIQKRSSAASCEAKYTCQKDANETYAHPDLCLRATLPRQYEHFVRPYNVVSWLIMRLLHNGTQGDDNLRLSITPSRSVIVWTA